MLASILKYLLSFFIENIIIFRNDKLLFCIEFKRMSIQNYFIFCSSFMEKNLFNIFYKKEKFLKTLNWLLAVVSLLVTKLESLLLFLSF